MMTAVRRNKTSRIDITFLDLPSILQNLASNQRTGILTARRPGRSIGIRFEGGIVRMVIDPADRHFLLDALVRSGQVGRADIERALRQGIDTTRPLGEQLRERGLVDDDGLAEAYIFHVTEAVCEVFSWQDVECEFVHGPPDDEWVGGDLGYDLEIHPSALLLEACRRADETARFQESIPSLDDVPLAAADRAEAVPSIEAGLVIDLVDGIRSVQEILDEAPLSRFVALETLHGLVGGGRLRLRTPAELAEAACSKGALDHLPPRLRDLKRVRLLERAEATGLVDERLDAWLADACRAAGRKAEAGARLLRVARGHLASGRSGEALDALQRARELAPGDLDIRKALAEALIDGEQIPAAIRLVEGIVADLRAAGEPDQARAFAEGMKVRLPASDGLALHLAEMLAERGERTPAILLYEELAHRFVDRGEGPRAIDLFERILDLDPDHTLAHWNLARTLQDLGRLDEAVERFKALADSLSTTDLRDSINWQFLIQIYERITQIEPHSITAREWLVGAYLARLENDRALPHLRILVDLLRGDPGEGLLWTSLERLLELAPEDRDAHRLQAELHLETSNDEAAVAGFLTVARLALAQMAVEGGDSDEARQAIERARSIDPLAPDLHRALAGLHRAAGDLRAAATCLRDLAALEMARGDLEAAERSVRQASQADGAPPLALFDIAERLRAAGRWGQARRLYQEFAERALADRNFGLVGRACQAALKMGQEGTGWAREMLHQPDVEGPGGP